MCRGPLQTGTPRSTYLADSAKAWGGVAAAPPPTAEAKIKPGEQTFGVEELKGGLLAGLSCGCKEHGRQPVSGCGNNLPAALACDPSQPGDAYFCA